MLQNCVRLVSNFVTALMSTFAAKAQSDRKSFQPHVEGFEKRITPAGYGGYPYDLYEIGSEVSEQHSMLNKPIGSSTVPTPNSMVTTTITHLTSKDVVTQKIILANDANGTGFETYSSQDSQDQTTTTVITNYMDGSGVRVYKTTYVELVSYGDEESYQVPGHDNHNTALVSSTIKGFYTKTVTSDGKGNEVTQWTSHEDIVGTASHNNENANDMGKNSDVFAGSSTTTRDGSGMSWNWANGNSNSVSFYTNQGRFDMKSDQAIHNSDGSYTALHMTTANNFVVTNSSNYHYFAAANLNISSSQEHSMSLVVVAKTTDAQDAQKNYSHADVNQHMTWEGFSTWMDSSVWSNQDNWSNKWNSTTKAIVNSSFDVKTLNKNAAGVTVTGTATNQFAGTRDTFESGLASSRVGFPDPIRTERKTFKDDPKITFGSGTLTVSALSNMIQAVGLPEEDLYNDPYEAVYLTQASYGKG